MSSVLYEGWALLTVVLAVALVAVLLRGRRSPKVDVASASQDSPRHQLVVSRPDSIRVVTNEGETIAELCPVAESTLAGVPQVSFPIDRLSTFLAPAKSLLRNLAAFHGNKYIMVWSAKTAAALKHGEAALMKAKPGGIRPLPWHETEVLLRMQYWYRVCRGWRRRLSFGRWRRR